VLKEILVDRGRSAYSLIIYNGHNQDI